MLMPVLRKLTDDDTELTLVDLKDVLYINIENRGIVYHTREEKLYHLSTLTDLEEHLSELGFDLLDKTNIVNMKQVKSLDERHGNIYFDEDPTKNSKFASVAFIKQKLLKTEISQAICRNTGKTLTFQASTDHNHKNVKDKLGFQQG
jgi:DNA-binding LytR/AlgR family response regulator